jgi:dihydrofolate reductase
VTGRLVYTFNVSLDGYINDRNGDISWGSVDDELHGWFNDNARASAADLYGRRLYELMSAYWPNALHDPDTPPVERDFARVWNALPRIVFSRTLETAPHATRLLHVDVVDAVDDLKREFDGDIGVGGATLASSLVERNLIDEYQLIVHPVVVGGGTPYFPPGARLDLRLIETRQFGNGALLMRYVPR